MHGTRALRTIEPLAETFFSRLVNQLTPPGSKLASPGGQRFCDSRPSLVALPENPIRRKYAPFAGSEGP